MGRYVVEEEKEKEPIADDAIFPAKVVAVNEIEKEYRNDDGTKDKKPRVKFKFKLDAPGTPWDGWHLSGDVPAFMTTGVESRFRLWAEALLDAELPAGYSIETDDLVNRTCRVVVGYWEREDATTGIKKSGNWVKEILPMSGLRQAAPAGTPPMSNPF